MKVKKQKNKKIKINKINEKNKIKQENEDEIRRKGERKKREMR